MKHIIFYLILLSTCLSSEAQIYVDTCTIHCFNDFTNSHNFIKSYKITNNTEDKYVTFVSSDFTNSISNIEAIHRFFKKQIGDFSLSFLVYEKLLTAEFTNRIGTTFMKEINPKETFEYLITKKEKESSFYEKRIFVIPLKEIEDFLQQTIPDDCFSSIDVLPLFDTSTSNVSPEGKKCQ